MMIDILGCKRRHAQQEGFCNLPESLNEQDDIARESKGVEYTLSKLYENKTRA